MNAGLIILASVALSAVVTVGMVAVIGWIMWMKLPGLRLRLQRFLLSASPGGLGVLDPKISEMERRLGAAERALRRQGKIFEKEVEAGRKAERAMADVLQGLTRSALHSDERLNHLERRDG